MAIKQLHQLTFVLSAGLSMFAQDPQVERRISGCVLDTAGNPIPNAWIDHTGKPRMSVVTDARGLFVVRTSAPAVVVRKPGFKSYLLRTQDASSVRVVLEGISGARRCQLSQLPRFITRESKDSDYISTTVTLSTKLGPKTLVCGKGGNWSTGIPSDGNVWQSIVYSEVVHGNAGEPGIVDAYGKRENGTYWRYKGTFGDSCFYTDVDEVTAMAFDCLIEAGVTQ